MCLHNVHPGGFLLLLLSHHNDSFTPQTERELNEFSLDFYTATSFTLEIPIFSCRSISVKTSCTDICSIGSDVLLNPTSRIPLVHNLQSYDLVNFTLCLMHFSFTSKALRDHPSVSGHGESVSNWLWMVLMANSSTVICSEFGTLQIPHGCHILLLSGI